MVETIPIYRERFGKLLIDLEWIFTVFFTVEYVMRIYCVRRPSKYIFSFYGIVDLLSIIPTYLSIFIVGSQSLIVIRAIRLLRIFRIFKLFRFIHSGKVILLALRDSREKLTVFSLFIILVVCIFGSIMYLVEGHGASEEFDSIPRSIYWAIVTITTVGYGDISPHTPFGQFLASFIMILGYAIIAVPTGIVTGEILKRKDTKESTQVCQFCNKEGHENDATYCKFCGEHLNPQDLTGKEA